MCMDGWRDGGGGSWSVGRTQPKGNMRQTVRSVDLPQRWPPPAQLIVRTGQSPQRQEKGQEPSAQSPNLLAESELTKTPSELWPTTEQTAQHSIVKTMPRKKEKKKREHFLSVILKKKKRRSAFCFCLSYSPLPPVGAPILGAQHAPCKDAFRLHITIGRELTAVWIPQVLFPQVVPPHYHYNPSRPPSPLGKVTLEIHFVC